ncbi:MAG: hypothetical protein KAY32_15455 [Candidatus Eisenbacteria sp.]|nr:hypothetical protein [Candidatus Eisenbacteria bacterium]
MFEDSYKKAKKIEMDAERAFQRDERYRIGKLEEVRMFNYLTSIGYKVTDISKERNEQNYWSPFDLLAESKYYSFFADVKYRSSRGGFPIDTEKVDFWLSYERPNTKVNDRIVIICTPGRQDSFVSVADIQDFYSIGRSLMIPRDGMRSIIIIRKILEHCYRDDTSYSLASYTD